ncbi:MAG: hypothetical protein GF355_16430 [Candidatus Eisenbacteria bacterium]|nr:hypothetical protein [Candidatus Eisenbacteria bacterium]
MNEDASILEIFKDPLLSIIALIMMGTLWIIVPQAGGSPELQEEIQKLEERITQIQLRIEILSAELESLVVPGGEAFDDPERIAAGVEQLRERLRALEDELNRLQIELAQLEQQLGTQRGAGEDEPSLAELERRISRLREQIAEAAEQLRRLQDELKRARAAVVSGPGASSGSPGSVREVEARIIDIRAAISELEAKKTELENTISQASGIGAYTESAVRNKEEILFEGLRNRLFHLDEKSYRREAFRTIHNGRIVNIVKWVLRDSAKGVGTADLDRPGNEFRRRLEEADPRTHYVFLGVQKDSFEVFRKARQIAWDMGFVVSWNPWEAGPIYSGPGDPRIGRSSVNP